MDSDDELARALQDLHDARAMLRPGAARSYVASAMREIRDAIDRDDERAAREDEMGRVIDQQRQCLQAAVLWLDRSDEPEIRELIERISRLREETSL